MFFLLVILIFSIMVFFIYISIDFLFLPFIVLVPVLVATAFFTLAERKLMASIQRRSGPNVVGFWGFLQPVADGLKLLTKERCEKNSYILLWETKENFQDQYTGIQSFLCNLLLKQVYIGSLKELIRKNPVEPLISWPIWLDSFGMCIVVSNVSVRMKALFKNNIHINNKEMGSFYGNGLMCYNFSRINRNILWGRRGYRKFFCHGREVTIVSGSQINDNNLSNKIPDIRVSKTKFLIISKDFNKGIVVYNSFLSIIDKIFTFKIHKCGKYIDLTKNFLTDPKFLKFAFYLISNIRVSGINDVWFTKTAQQIKDSTYKFKPAKQVSIVKSYKDGKRFIAVTADKDQIIQKAMAVVLDLMYERNGCFHEESHGFRPNKSCHTALKQIKLGWSFIPYYINMDINKGFGVLNHKVLINILRERICDKRFLGILNKMYTVNILCPQGFWIKNTTGFMEGNVLSPILCNIYLDKLDLFIKHEIINKMSKGEKPKVNRKFIEKIELDFQELKLPQYLKIKLINSRRKHVEKLGIKKIIENEDFIRIKYVRYSESFLIAVRGSLEIAKKIKDLVKNFLNQVLYIRLNEAKTKITNTYSGKVPFLGMLIYNINPSDLPYRNSREIENTKRVSKKKDALKQNALIKIQKDTRKQSLKTLTAGNIKEVLLKLGIKGKARSKIRDVPVTLNTITTEVVDQIEPKQKRLVIIPKSVPTQKPITEFEFCKRIHEALLKYNACSTDRVKKGWYISIKKFFKIKKLTSCPNEINLNDKDLKKIIFKGSEIQQNDYSTSNWLVIVKQLLDLQKTKFGINKISYSAVKTDLVREKVINCSRPMIVADRDKIYAKLKSVKIINSKNNPSCKYDIMSCNDFNIILYFNTVGMGLLSYFRCTDDFFKIKSLVNWFVRNSAISTIKHKHKLGSRQAVCNSFGLNPTFTNDDGKSISLISKLEIMGFKKSYLNKPDIEWFKKSNLMGYPFYKT